MKPLYFAFAALAATTAGMAAAPVTAAPIPLTGTMLANYFTVTAGGMGDFETYCCSDVRSDLVQSTLGPNGLPVYNTASVGPQAMKGYDATTKELQWWTPGVTNGGDTVVATSSTLVGFPYSNHALFPLDGMGGDNSNGFQTVHFTSSLNLGASYNVTFSLDADDDAFLFIGGKLFTGVGGVHGNTAAPTVTKRFGPGSYSFDLFFADRHTVASSLDVSGSIAAVPEPGVWALMIVGFGLVGVSSRRRQATVAA